MWWKGSSNRRPLCNGWFIQPTVIEGLDQGMPHQPGGDLRSVVTIQPFDTEEEALAMANGVRYGLATTVWTSDLQACPPCRRPAGIRHCLGGCWLPA